MIMGVLIYFFVGPEGCPETETIPPFLYISLYVLLAIIHLVLFNEVIIFSISLKGSIVHNQEKRKYLPYFLFARVGLMLVEIFWVIVCIGTAFGPAPHAANALECPKYHDGPLAFTKVVLILLLATILIYFLVFAFYLDPFGLCCPTSMWQDLEWLRNELEADKASKKKINEDDDGKDELEEYLGSSRLGRLHRSHRSHFVGFRWLCRNKNRFCSTAMHEMEKVLTAMFGNEDKLPSDITAGLILLGRHQRETKQECAMTGDLEGQYMHREFSKVMHTHAHMHMRAIHYFSSRSPGC